MTSTPALRLDSAPPVDPPRSSGSLLRFALPEDLGSEAFRADYNARYAYVAGAMYKGIASPRLVVRMGKAGMLSFLGTGGQTLAEIEEAIRIIQHELDRGQPYGVNFLHHPGNPALEHATVDLFLKHGIRNVEASAFMSMTEALVKYRLKGLREGPRGQPVSHHLIMAKISRPEVAEAFLSPAPEPVVRKLLAAGHVTAAEAELSRRIAMCDDVCAEADSGGHTDGAVSMTLLPTIVRLRDQVCRQHGYHRSARVGAAGGIGTPEAIASVLMLGADFVVTGSINQCTVEATTSDPVKDMLQEMNIQDTEYAPAGDMFELGAKVQVLKRGVFFPVRANKLYDLWRQFDAWEQVDERTRRQIEEKFFAESFESVYASTRLALAGDLARKVDYQVHTGPALGAFNQWVKGSRWESWRSRHVDEIGLLLMSETSALLKSRLAH